MRLSIASWTGITADITALSKNEVEEVTRVFSVVNTRASKMRHRKSASGFQRADKICMASIPAVNMDILSQQQ
jgi:hypothetical protein